MVKIVNKEPKKYIRYVIEKNNSPRQGILPINAKIEAMVKKNNNINVIAIGEKTIACQCFFINNFESFAEKNSSPLICLYETLLTAVDAKKIDIIQ